MPSFTTNWYWEEAFDKFGFDDGDGLIMTGDVVSTLGSAGYKCLTESLGMHNEVISYISAPDGTVLWWDEMPDLDIGYTDPRTVLPPDLIEILDRALPSDTPYPGF